jgi:mRNA-degrading endonuclease RelE of RelBE toxin-antitoxin system
LADEPRLEIRYSEAAASQIAEARARGEARPDSSHATYWKALRRLLQELLPIPEHAFAPGTMLRDEFAGLGRVKFGRHRLIYVASREKRILVVLFIGFRKEGDKHDAYRELDRRLRAGEFASCLAQVGVVKKG